MPDLLCFANESYSRIVDLNYTDPPKFMICWLHKIQDDAVLKQEEPSSPVYIGSVRP
jgi:hypothetical protein